VIVPSKSVKKMNLGSLNGLFIAGSSAAVTMFAEARVVDRASLLRQRDFNSKKITQFRCFSLSTSKYYLLIPRPQSAWFCAHLIRCGSSRHRRTPVRIHSREIHVEMTSLRCGLNKFQKLPLVMHNDNIAQEP
jgi:hypothetical protein